MSQLRHPRIVQFLGAAVTADERLIVLEYCARGALGPALRGLADPPETLVVALALDIARGMEFLHSRSVIHRDLKSANVLVTTEWEAKVGDFGVSRVMEGLTQMTTGVGSVPWSAPEVLSNESYTLAADVFSFAIVLWELGTCELIYPNMTASQITFGVLREGLRPSVDLLRKGFSPALVEMMQRCWLHEAEARPSFQEIVHVLEALPHDVAPHLTKLPV
mmetsp:Transcript_28157/g.66678  ORF Transcript_28157/g.66678 Transcript_28157/m.66678 type:complete len:220 (+) Transcript_28157:44-703(+)